MIVIISLVYLLFTACVIYPPTEFVTAGFTISQIFDWFLGSENTDFVTYHMRRTAITILVHSFLPLGYWFSIVIGGWRSEWLGSSFAVCLVPVLLTCIKITSWWEHHRLGHPVVETLLPYVTQGSHWRVVAAGLNTEFKNVNKVILQMGTTSKFIATPTWFIKVGQYRVDVVRQTECTLVATGVDQHTLSATGDDEVQYLNMSAIPNRIDVKGFKFRINASSLRDLNPRLFHPVIVPTNLPLLPTLIERFVSVFKEYVDKNPVYVVPEDEEIAQCIGCMQEPANVKIVIRCIHPPVHFVGEGPTECLPCNCKVVWCVACMARWWASRVGNKPPTQWLRGRCTCPVCRSPFCLLDLRPAVRRTVTTR